VAPAYADAMGWPRTTIGQKLVHHHINNSRFVLPSPATRTAPMSTARRLSRPGRSPARPRLSRHRLPTRE